MHITQMHNWRLVPRTSTAHGMPRSAFHALHVCQHVDMPHRTLHVRAARFSERNCSLAKEQKPEEEKSEMRREGLTPRPA